MTSLLTNDAAMSALRALTATQRQLSRTQAQVSSGLAVANASDDAAYWSIATTMKAQTSAIDAASTGSALGKAIVDIAYKGLTNIIQDMAKMKDLVIDAQTSGVDRVTVDFSLADLENHIMMTAANSNFNGINLLQTDVNADNSSTFTQNITPQTNIIVGIMPNGRIQTVNAALQVPLFGAKGAWLNQTPPTYGLLDMIAYTNGADGSHIPASIPVYSGYRMTDMRTSTLSGVAGYATDPPTMLTADGEQIDALMSYLGGYAARLGSISSAISTMQTFNAALSDALTSGVGALLDADMNVASTRLQALQTQQQLGIQTLSMANYDSGSLLKLFQVA